jgi:hypothetical protein
VTVYYGRGSLWFLFLGSAGFVAAAVVLGLSGPDSSGFFWWVVGMLFVGVVILFFGTGMLLGLLLLIRRKPYLMLDHNGLECAQGSVLWSDVERVVEVLRTADDWTTRSLLLVLRLGTALAPPTKDYRGGRGILGDWIERRGESGPRWLSRFGKRIGDKYGLPRLASPVLEVSLMHCRKKVLKSIDRFYAKPVPAVRLEDLAAELDGEYGLEAYPSP